MVECIVCQDFAECEDKPLPPKIALYSQTTKDNRKLKEIKQKLEARGVKVDFNDTICRQVSNRDVQLRNFVKQFDKIVFVSGTKSSNGKVLYEVCKEFNPRSYFVSHSEEVKKEWFSPND